MEAKTEILKDQFGEYVLLAPYHQYNCVCVNESEITEQIMTDDEQELQNWVKENEGEEFVIINKRKTCKKGGEWKDMNLVEYVNFLDEYMESFDEISKSHLDAFFQV